jgi:hypothetical protein
MKKTLRIYGCGGAGINNAAYFQSAVEQQVPGHAELEIAYIDTSKANLTDAIPTESVYIVPLGDKKDGAGKVRGQLASDIEKHIPQILQKHAPGDFNIVLASTTGGSGNVAASLLQARLLELGIPVVAIFIGSAESALSAQNNVKVIESLDKMARGRNVPMSMFYVLTDPLNDGYTATEADSEARRLVSYISRAVSGENSRVDSSDVINWVFYNRVTQVKPQLALIDYCLNDDELKDVEFPISLFSLSSNPDYYPPVAAGYICDGLLAPAGNDDDLKQLQLVITTVGVEKLYSIAKERLTAIQQQQASLPETSALGGESDSTGSGLIL